MHVAVRLLDLNQEIVNLVLTNVLNDVLGRFLRPSCLSTPCSLLLPRRSIGKCKSGASAARTVECSTYSPAGPSLTRAGTPERRRHRSTADVESEAMTHR